MKGGLMPYVEGVARNQIILFPEKIDDYIREDNTVQFVDAFVDVLDLGALGFKRAQPQEIGRPPYDPGDMLKLYLWGYLNRIRSSRSLERESHSNLEVMWLIKKLTPDFKTIADFRKDNKEAIKKVCKEFILLCKRLELFGGELVAIDSSKFRAVNCKKRNFNKAKLEHRIREIEKAVDEYFKELEDNDNKEASAEAVKAEELKARIQWLKEKGEEYKALLKRLIKSGESQISLTDPDSRAMMNNQRVEVCYNVQATVDSKHKLILDHEVTNEGTDYNYLGKMAQRAKDILGAEKLEVLADKGYYDAEQIKECVAQGIIPYIPEKESHKYAGKDLPQSPFSESKFRYEEEKDCYICPGGSELTFRRKREQNGRVMKIYQGEDCQGCTLRAQCTTHLRGRTISRWEYKEILEDMRQRVANNRHKVKIRQWLSEHPFGTMKRGFNQGYLLLKGLAKVEAEISLTILSYNVKRTINILGLRALISALRQCPATSPSL
jgi:transposase